MEKILLGGLFVVVLIFLLSGCKEGFDFDKHVCLEDSVLEIKDGGFSKEQVEAFGSVDEFVKDYNDRWKKYGGLYDCEWEEIDGVIRLACSVCGEWEVK